MNGLSADSADYGGFADLDQLTSSDVELLSEEVLVRISRGPLTKFIQESEEDHQVLRIWQSLFRTFSARSTTRLQTRAACNAVTVFLDAALMSRNAKTRALSLSHEIWLAVFEVCLLRYEDASPKPIKQVLTCLVRVLKQQNGTEDAALSRRGAVDLMLPSIVLSDPRSRIRASLLALEQLVRDNVLLPSQLAPLLYDWFAAHHARWIPTLRPHCDALSIETAHYTSTTPRRYDECDEQRKLESTIIFTLSLLTHATNPGYAPSAASLLALLYKKAAAESRTTDGTSVPFSWVHPVRHILLQSMDSLEAVSNAILAPLLSADIDGFNAFVSHLPINAVLSGDMKLAGSIDELILLFSALHIGKSAGFVHEDYAYGKPVPALKGKDPLILDSKVLGQFLLHTEPIIRISTLSLIIAANYVTKPLSVAAMDTILRGLPSMQADADAQMRQKIMSLIRKLMVRLRGSANSLRSTVKSDLEHEKTFLQNYVDFLESELRAGISYQRHIAALQSLSIVLNTGIDPRVKGTANTKIEREGSPWRFQLDILRPRLFRLLVDLLLDPFEDVRGAALSLLSLFPRDSESRLLNDTQEQFDTVEKLVKAASRAESLASHTSRADHADTVARLYHAIFASASVGRSSSQFWYGTKAAVVDTLLGKLDRKLGQAGGIFSSSIKDAPLHGYVSALRYIVATPEFHTLLASDPEESIMSWRRVHDRIVVICNKIWQEVKPVLCIDSPEGHTDEATDDLMVGPKDILSYSWRALRESSLLLHAIVANATYGPANSASGLNRSDYEAIGVLSFIQLSELRHRGAFTAVSQTFATCCQRCGEHTDPEISSLPEVWYQESLKIIHDKADKLTRRSAGLPALVTGIALSKPGGALFHRILAELQEIAKLPAVQKESYTELSLPQVHAMNCLKDILSNSKLVSYTESFIMPCLNISADSFSSPIWAIRNCALMLFRVLMTRMCRLLHGTTFGFGGPSGCESGMRISFGKYPGLVELTSRLLASATQDRDSMQGDAASETQKVFPALAIIAEKTPSTVDDDDKRLQKLVLRQVKSDIWAVRDQAGRVFASLLRPTEIIAGAANLLQKEAQSFSQNQLQGHLLCLQYSLRRMWYSGQSSDNHQRILSLVATAFAKYFATARSPFVLTVLIDILIDALESSMQIGKTAETSDFASNIFAEYGLESKLAQLLHQSRSYTARGESLLRRSLVWCVILNSILKDFPEAITDHFLNVSDADRDAACWVLRRIDWLFPGYEQQERFLEMYAQIILRGREESIKARAVLNLSRALEDALECGHTVALLEKWALIANHLYQQSQDNVWSREMTENTLRLQGCLLCLKYIEPAVADSNTDLSRDFLRWTVSLRSALSEETVFSSRYAAVMSFRSFSKALRRADKFPAATDSLFLHAYLILYDMLNDDDEELRDLSAEVASRILSYSSIYPGKTVSLGCVPARENLLEFIVQNYHDDDAAVFLFREGVRRIVGNEAFSTVPGQVRPLAPFAERLSEYRKESTVLFEEERQNLFIDDVREADLWTNALKNKSVSAFDPELVRQLSDWVSEGLEHLVSAASRNDEDDVLGWTSKQEVYTVGTQLLNAASLLVAKGESLHISASETRMDIVGIKEKLRALLEKGREISLHPHWLARIEVMDISQ